MPLSEQALLHLNQHPLLKGFSEEELQLFQQLLEEKEYQQDEMVSKAGEFSAKLYLLIKGSLAVAKSNIFDPTQLTTHLLQSPNILGETSFLNPSPQLYEIKAGENSTLVLSADRQQLKDDPLALSLSNKILLNLVRIELEGLRPSSVVLEEQFQKEEIFETKRNSVQSIKERFLSKWLPKEMSREEREEIEEIVEIQHVEEEENCIQQKDPVQSLHVLIEGQLNVLEWNEAKHHSILIDILNPGDNFGENSLLAPFFSPYTIQAFRPSTLLLLSRKKLEQFSEKSAIKKLSLHLAQYTPEQSGFIKKNYGESSFLPKEDPSLPEEPFNQLDFLRHHPLTENLNTEERVQLNQLLHYQEYEKGEKITQVPENRRDLYFLLQGQVVLIKNREKALDETSVEKLQPRAVFNEVSFVTGRSTPMTIEITKKAKILQLPFEKLKESIDAKDNTVLKLLTNSARLMEDNSEHLKNKDESSLRLKVQHLLKQRALWIFCLLGLILSYLGAFKDRNSLLNSGITLLQILVPIGFIYGFLKDSLKNWGWASKYLNPSLLQAVVCIGLVGALFELIAQVIDLSSFHFFSPRSWHLASWSFPTLLNYLLFVSVEEWLRRGVIVLSLKRALEDTKGRWSIFLSALLFLGYSAVYSPFLSLALFIKDLGLGFLFLRAPHLLGVILIHFTLGLFFASLGWFLL